MDESMEKVRNMSVRAFEHALERDEQSCGSMKCVASEHDLQSI